MTTATPRPGRPRRSAAALAAERRRVAREALRLFAQDGVAATSADDVARAAGVSVRTFWRLFPRKEDAVRPLLEDGVVALAADVRARGLAGLLGAATPARPEPGPSDAASDAEPIRTLVRLTRTEPAVRGVWLDVHDGAESVLADALAASRGEAVPGLGTRTTAAVANAALRVAVEEWAWQETGTESGAPAASLARRVDEALRLAADALGRRADETPEAAPGSPAD
ncbi:TetR family transcriptional regulator [Luteimicrobium sp. NPDC057192]|uniref:TetR/AcrR family transcriptional regulator n=1 Tax=Luteimicrobium sp. NPDC057192 TaxID=3346042 RepID=UPI003635802E